MPDQASGPATARNAREPIVAVALTFAGGFVDGYGFLTLSQVYVSNMSGNSVQIGVGAADNGAAVLLHGFTVAAFLVGLLIGGTAIEIGRRRRYRRIFAMAMALEIVALGAFIAIAPDGPGERPTSHLLAPIAAAAVAMGLQNTSLRMAHILTTYTTHVTGTITRFSEDVVAWLVGRVGGNWGGDDRPGHGRAALLSGALWASFVLGSLFAAVLMPEIGRSALLLPLGIVIAAAAADAAAPMAVLPETDRRRR